MARVVALLMADGHGGNLKIIEIRLVCMHSQSLPEADNTYVYYPLFAFLR